MKIHEKKGILLKYWSKSSPVILFAVRILAGCFLALTLALAGRSIWQYGITSFVFVFSIVLLFFLQAVRKLKMLALFLLLFMIVTSFLLLRAYIFMAPGG